MMQQYDLLENTTPIMRLLTQPYQEAVAVAATAPSKAAIRCSKTAIVGLKSECRGGHQVPDYRVLPHVRYL